MGRWGDQYVKRRNFSVGLIVCAAATVSSLWAGEVLDSNKAASVCVVAGVTAFAAAYPFLFEHDPQWDLARKWINAVCILLMGAVAAPCVGARHPPSTYIRDAMRCIIGFWFRMVLYSFFSAFKNYRNSETLDFRDYVEVFFLGFGFHFEGVLTFLWTACLMARRLQIMDGNESFTSRAALPLMCMMGTSYQIFQTVNDILMRAMHTRLLWVHLSFVLFFMSLWVLYSALLVRRLKQNLNGLRRETADLPQGGAARVEAMWAVEVLRMELFACATLGVTTTLNWAALVVAKLVKYVSELEPPPGNHGWASAGKTGDSHGFLAPRVSNAYLVVFIVSHVDAFVNLVSIAGLSGLLWQAKQPEVKGKWKMSQVKRPEALRKWNKSEVPTIVVSEWSSRSSSTQCRPPGWHEKVEELADRGVCLGDLLGFWHRLLEKRTVMQSFEPTMSTTNDVVRQVIIPESRSPDPAGGGTSMAALWNARPRLARCMVTHNWSNLFWYLMAGIVADCLGEDSYEGVADKLLSVEGLKEIRQAIGYEGANMTYWICAFSVNQHASICSVFGRPPEIGTEEFEEWRKKTVDTVTREQFRLCGCSQPKHFNDSPAQCEMNKFDDMMRWVTSKPVNFSHLVVVDMDFEVFSRAWCVAEIVEASESRIPQRIIIHSDETLDANYETLSVLDVQLCKASRPEDKEMILSNISNIASFNNKLQWSIFGTEGLFSRQMDGQERAARIRRIMRRSRINSAQSTNSSETPLDRMHGRKTTSRSARSTWSGVYTSTGDESSMSTEEAGLEPCLLALTGDAPRLRSGSCSGEDGGSCSQESAEEEEEESPKGCWI